MKCARIIGTAITNTVDGMIESLRHCEIDKSGELGSWQPRFSLSRARVNVDTLGVLRYRYRIASSRIHLETLAQERAAQCGRET